MSTLGGTPGTLTLTATSQAGLTITFKPSTVVMNTGAGPTSLTVTGQAAASLAGGIYPVTISAIGNGQIYTETLNVQVSKYLFVVNGAFMPSNMTVPIGATVSWVRINGPLGCGCVDDGGENIHFADSSLTSSAKLMQYDTYSVTFTKAGTFPFTDDFHPGVGGFVTVTP
jgi:plastocyanin